MWIKRSEFDRLKKYEHSYEEVARENIECVRKIRNLQAATSNLEEQNVELRENADQLAMQISAEVTDCKMGPWCLDCAHYADVPVCFSQESYEGESYVWRRGHTVSYCKKHLHERCQEFERRADRC